MKADAKNHLISLENRVFLKRCTITLRKLLSEQGLNIAIHSHPCDQGIPFILNIAIHSHPCDHGIPFILNIAIHSHPCDHGIPFILNIKSQTSLLGFSHLINAQLEAW